ncbi:MAG: VCBS repeat-containing protein [Candidatus Heimdallarchaeota archaeon]|nr:VCBS repeat-containing protein [Candidatus Heimdallarchaeota archaeon]
MIKQISILLCIVIISSMHGPIINNNTTLENMDDSFIRNFANNEGFLPINYDIYHGFANGTSQFQHSVNSMTGLDAMIDNVTYPFNDKIPLGGSDNLAYLNYAGFNVLQEVGTYSSSFYSTLSDPDVYTLSSMYPTSIAVGDFDGDKQPDLVILEYTGSVVLMKVITHSGRFDTHLTFTISSKPSLYIANNQNIGAPSEIQIPQVIAGNFDDDPIEEFAILYIDDFGVQNIRVFDDLMNSHELQPVRYGDYIVLEESVFDLYVQSTGNDLISGSNDAHQISNWVPNSKIDADLNLRFKILNPNDIASTEQVGFGYPIVLQDINGNYISYSDGDAVMVRTSITTNEIFTILDESQVNESDSAIYESDIVTIQSPYGLNTFLAVNDIGTSTFDGYSPSYPNPFMKFKIYSANALPNHFAVDPTIYTTNFEVAGILQGLPITTGTDMIQGGSVNFMTADIDSDNRTELVVAGLNVDYRPVSYIYDDAVSSFTLLHSFQWNNEKNVFPNIVSGDLNGDGFDELVYSYSNVTSATIYIYNHLYQLIHTITDAPFGEFPGVSVGDVDGDGSAELIYVDDTSHLSIYDDQNNGFNLILRDYFIFNTNDIPPGLSLENEFNVFGTDNLTRMQAFSNSFPQVALGDFNLDGVQEIGLNVFAKDASNNPYYVTVILSISHNPMLIDYRIENNGYIPTLIAGDFDADSYVVEFTGNHTAFTTPGELFGIAVASPVQSRIDQNFDDSNTLFGISVSQSSTESNEFSTSYGAFIKFEQEIGIFGIKLAQFETRAGFVFEFNQRQIRTNTTIKTTEFHGDAADDSVIFTTAVYDFYAFKVISSKYLGQIGKTFTLSIPNTPALYKQHKTFYNQNNINSVINSTILSSTPGELDTYMSYSQLVQHTNIYATGTMIESDEVQVGQGEGYNSVKIDISEHNTTGFSKSYNFDFEVSGGVFGLSVGYTFGLTSTYAYETVMGSSTSFGIDVGDIIDSQDYTMYRYGFGLGVYQMDVNNHGSLQSPWIINSWVNLPDSWVAPPMIISSDSNTNGVSTGDGDTTTQSGLFPIPINFLFFIIGLFPILLLKERKRANHNIA